MALRRNLAAALFEHETISTTIQKAKHVKSFIEKLITIAKKGNLTARRRALSLLPDRDIVEEVDGGIEKKGTIIKKLFSDIAPRYLDRPGGYTRIIKLAKRRLGDNGQLVLLQLVGKESQPPPAQKGGKKKASKKKTAKAAQEEGE
jgi:large subunit ribosomal protein L17